MRGVRVVMALGALGAALVAGAPAHADWDRPGWGGWGDHDEWRRHEAREEAWRAHERREAFEREMAYRRAMWWRYHHPYGPAAYAPPGVWLTVRPGY